MIHITDYNIKSTIFSLLVQLKLSNILNAHCTEILVNIYMNCNGNICEWASNKIKWIQFWSEAAYSILYTTTAYGIEILSVKSIDMTAFLAQYSIQLHENTNIFVIFIWALNPHLNILSSIFFFFIDSYWVNFTNKINELCK